ncbi:hypothetical protein GCM10022232_23400 [Streptomyces plumbiresistens]|uniref:Uncharacterized protein n=1 Tax=Streptomyces plumbiresistens TaxID=511811 RepID=A0ABP7QXR2_9ACTN
MPNGQDPRGDIHLFAECDSDRIKASGLHQATLHNLTELRLFDAHFKVSTSLWVNPVLEVAYQAHTYSSSSRVRHGSVSAGKQAVKEFELQRSGWAEGVEVVTTVVDWSRDEPYDPTIAEPTRRFDRICEYDIEVGD